MRYFAFVLFLHIFANAQAQEVRLPKYLKTWNETLTYRQALDVLAPNGSTQLREWYGHHLSLNTPHQTSVEFLDRDQFFINSPRRLFLYNTARLSEGILLISRKPFRVQADETYASLEQRLEEHTHGRPTKSLFSEGLNTHPRLNFFLSALATLWLEPATAARSATLEWAPVVSMLDIFWQSQPKITPSLALQTKPAPNSTLSAKSTSPGGAPSNSLTPESLNKPTAARK